MKTRIIQLSALLAVTLPVISQTNENVAATSSQEASNECTTPAKKPVTEQTKDAVIQTKVVTQASAIVSSSTEADVTAAPAEPELTPEEAAALALKIQKIKAELNEDTESTKSTEITDVQN